MFRNVIAAVTLLVTPMLGSTKAVYPVWQPISLHGTDVTSVPGKTSDVDFGVVMSRPLVVSGALPEALVYAVALGHKMESIGTYDEKECNLLVLYNIKVDPTMTEKGLTVVFDLSQMATPENMEVGARDALKLGIEALKLTLQNYADAHLHKDLACIFSVEGLTEKNQSFRDLGEKFVIPAVVRPSEENEVPLPGDEGKKQE